MEISASPDQTGLRADLPLLLGRLFDLLFCAYIFVTIFLPSGTIYGINLKLPLYAVMLPVAAYTFFSRGQATLQRLMFVLGAPALISVWVITSLCNGFALAGALRQYNDFALTLLLCWLVLLFCRDGESRRLQFLRLVLAAEVSTALLKVTLIAYALARGLPVVQIVSKVSIVFGVDLMTMDLGSLFGRVQFVSDALIPICIFIVLRHRDRLRIGHLRASATILILLISVLFGFSRYIWAFTALALVLGLLLGRRDRFRAVLLMVLGLVMIASLPILRGLYELRFSPQVAGESDMARLQQQDALKRFFVAAPFLGHGLGSYTHEVLRERNIESLRYGYEMQLLALSGQTGLLGMALLLLLLAWYYSGLWRPGILSVGDRLGLATLLLFWLAAGLYNPLLINPIASIIYASFATLTALGKEGQDVSTIAEHGADELSGRPRPKLRRLRLQWRSGTQALS